MNFINQYVSLLMEHPLTTPVVSLGLLALALHLILPLVCEIWRYYPNKITGTDTVKNAYLESIKKVTHEVHSRKYGEDDTVEYFNSKEEALAAINTSEFRNADDYHYATLPQYREGVITMREQYFWISLLGTSAATLISLLLEYLLANFFIYTLVAGLAVGLHFTVILLGKKVYSISEDVKTLKGSGNKAETEKENTNDD